MARFSGHYRRRVFEALSRTTAGELCADLVPAHGPVRAVSRLTEGSVTGAYHIEFAAAAPLVLKTYQPDWPAFARTEARALRFLSDNGSDNGIDSGSDISARLVAFSTAAPALHGLPCVLTTLRPGRTLTSVADQFTPAAWHDVYRQLGVVLQRPHAIPAMTVVRWLTGRSVAEVAAAVRAIAPQLRGLPLTSSDRPALNDASWRCPGGFPLPGRTTPVDWVDALGARLRALSIVE